MQNTALRATVLAAWMVAVAPGAGLADQAQIDAACAGPSTDRGERPLDPADPLDAVIGSRFAGICEGRLIELTDISSGAGIRTYRCSLWIPSAFATKEKLQAIDDVFGPELRQHTRRVGRFDFVGGGQSSLGTSVQVLFLARSPDSVEVVYARSSLETRPIEIRSAWAAVEWLHLTKLSHLPYRHNLCGNRVETDRDGWRMWKIRGCGTVYSYDVYVKRDGEHQISANLVPPDGVQSPCSD